MCLCVHQREAQNNCPSELNFCRPKYVHHVRIPKYVCSRQNETKQTRQIYKSQIEDQSRTHLTSINRIIILGLKRDFLHK